MGRRGPLCAGILETTDFSDLALEISAKEEGDGGGIGRGGMNDEFDDE